MGVWLTKENVSHMLQTDGRAILRLPDIGKVSSYRLLGVARIREVDSDAYLASSPPAALQCASRLRALDGRTTLSSQSGNSQRSVRKRRP